MNGKVALKQAGEARIVRSSIHDPRLPAGFGAGLLLKPPRCTH
ncbi:MAG TPA: hypothetical protein VEA99_05980 [Gemmatimonadaceae bacterium]|nr:hypothetical protein [Gemmatimonadaceae bacterium]